MYGPNYHVVRYSATGAVATGALQTSSFILPHPARLVSVAMNVTTAPTGADLIVDIQRSRAAAPQTFASIFGTVSQQAPRILATNFVLHPDLVNYAALSTQQQIAVASGLAGTQVANFKFNGYGFSNDYSTGGGGPRPTQYGAGAPASTTGNVGDWYIDTTNFRLYGPKQPTGAATGAGWPSTYTALTALNAVPAATQSTGGAVPDVLFASGDTFIFNVNQVGSTVAGSVLSASALFEWV